MISTWNNIFNLNIKIYVQIISNWLVSEMKWEKIEIEKSLMKKDFVVKDSVLQKNYQKVGLYPVVSQSKDLISGYSNDKELLIDQGLPIILFGDHTQVVKYIDFSFIIGADGVKILKPLDEYNPKFFYYLIKSIDLNSSKYARHYKILRSQIIPYKNKSFVLQTKIVNFLDDLSNNSLKDNTYFDHEIESKVLELHRSSLDINDLLYENKNQANIITQLKQSILQEAISGQLTAEWRSHHPIKKGDPNFDAKALLAKIKTEKEVLMAEGKLKKEKPLSEILSNNIPFDLPKSWVWCHLEEIVKLAEAGKSFLCRDRKARNEEWGIIKTSAITSGIFIESENKLYLESIPKNIKNKIEIGDLIFCRASGSKGFAGLCCLVESLTLNLLLSDKTIRVNLSNFVLPKIVNFYNKSQSSRKYRSLLSTQKSTSMNNITRGEILQEPFPLPPLAEQKIIVEKVDHIMKIIDQLEAQIKDRQQLAEDLMQTVLQEAFE